MRRVGRLVILSGVLSAALLLHASTFTPQGGSGQPGISHLEQVETLVLTLTNNVRRQRGLPALLPEETLRLIARQHSDDMLRRRFFSHENPDGQTPADRIALQHRRLIGATGENIWGGSSAIVPIGSHLAETIMNGWMSSPGHRDNILRREYTHLGVGVSAQGGDVRATQTFASVRVFLSLPLPLRVKRGAILNLSTTPFPESAANAEQYDFWSSNKERRVGDPVPITDGTVKVTPGVYTLRFYFPRPGGFTVYMGPRIEVE